MQSVAEKSFMVSTAMIRITLRKKILRSKSKSQKVKNIDVT